MQEQNKPEKIRWDLVPVRALEDCAKAMTLGAKKYGAENWRKLPDVKEQYYAAAMRHLTAWRKGKTKDPESGNTHLGHAIVCLCILHENEAYNIEPHEQWGYTIQLGTYRPIDGTTIPPVYGVPGCPPSSQVISRQGPSGGDYHTPATK